MTITDRALDLRNPETPFDFRIISTDSHVEEPIDDLIAQLPADLRTEVRHVYERDGEKVLHVPGLAPISIEFSERQMAGSGDNPKEAMREFRNDPEGGRNLERRIKEIESDGVWGEVIFPNRNLALGAHPNPRYQVAMASIYNKMLVDVFFSDQNRFAPAALLPTGTPEDAAAEVRSAKQLGFTSVTLPPVVPWLPYWHEKWEVLWQALEETNLPVNFHVFSGNTAQGVDFGNFWVIPDELVEYGRSNFKSERVDERLSTTAMCMASAMSPLMHLIGSGILERHPGMRFVLTESESGWIPWALQALDLMQARRRFGMINLSLKPSEYFHRQGWATFIEDRIAIDLLEYIGEDRLMWSNDWPHDEGTYGESMGILQNLIGHLPYKTQRKLLRDNAAALYGLDQVS